MRITGPALLYFKRDCYLFGCARSSLQHVGSSSLTKDWTWAPCWATRKSHLILLLSKAQNFHSLLVNQWYLLRAYYVFSRVSVELSVNKLVKKIKNSSQQGMYILAEGQSNQKRNGSSLAVQWLRLSAFAALNWVQSLFGELRSCKLCGLAKKKRVYSLLIIRAKEKIRHMVRRNSSFEWDKVNFI